MFASCRFDVCQLWNGLFLGTLASVLAAILVLWVQEYRRKKRLKQTYGKIAGTYLGYGFKESGEQWSQLKDEAQSEATIAYVGDNILNIELTGYPIREEFKWNGIITMDLETYGTVAWKYEIIGGKAFDGNKHEFGFKRIMVRTENNATYIYLVEEIHAKYAKEILVKQN